MNPSTVSVELTAAEIARLLEALRELVFNSVEETSATRKLREALHQVAA